MRYFAPLLAFALLTACGGGNDGPNVTDDTGEQPGAHDIATLPGDVVDDRPELDAGGSDSGTDSADPTDTADTDDPIDGDTGADAAPDVDPPDVDPADADTAPDLTDVDLDLPDGAECVGGVGCACEVHDECESGWCVLPFEGAGVCASAECDACPEDWSCEWRQVSGGERVELCVPDDVRWCAPCASADECGAGACLTLRDGEFCVPPCGPEDLCPAGTICRAASDEDPTRVCAPPGDRCIGCTDVDLDGYIAIGECGGTDCDDGEGAAFPGATEICDGLDNNCVDGIDEDWDLTGDMENCGGCGIVCDDSHGDLSCELGACVIDACDEGFEDCNEDGSDGCEVDIFGEFGCGECPGELGLLHDAACGVCGAGRWACSEGAGECVGGDTVTRNVCGGCAELEANPGDRCGTCETGLVLCDGPEAIRCDGDLGAAAENECGGCEALPGGPGDRCGTCNSGTYICDGSDDSICVGDRGDDAYNDCGGCAVLPGPIAARCGTCDTGVWACEGREMMTCDGEDVGAANECGGCGVLSETPRTSCGECDDGVWTCDGGEAVSCEGATIPGATGCADPACEGRDEGSLAESCRVPGDCCSGYCPSFPPSDRICSQSCSSYEGCNSGDPPEDLFCARDLGAPRLCAIDDFGAACAAGGECNGRLCLTSRPAGACSYQCGALRDCSPGNACGRFNSDGGSPLWACTDIGGPCAEPAECNSGVCLTGATTDYCTTFCEPDGIDGCPAGFNCMPLPGDGTYLCLR